MFSFVTILTSSASPYPCSLYISVAVSCSLSELSFLDAKFTLANYLAGQTTLAVLKLAVGQNSQELDVIVLSAFQKTLKAIKNEPVRNNLEWR